LSDRLLAALQIIRAERRRSRQDLLAARAASAGGRRAAQPPRGAAVAAETDGPDIGPLRGGMNLREQSNAGAHGEPFFFQRIPYLFASVVAAQ